MKDFMKVVKDLKKFADRLLKGLKGYAFRYPPNNPFNIPFTIYPEKNYFQLHLQAFS